MQHTTSTRHGTCTAARAAAQNAQRGGRMSGAPGADIAHPPHDKPVQAAPRPT